MGETLNSNRLRRCGLLVVNTSSGLMITRYGRGKVFSYQGEIIKANVPKMRAMTISGLCTFLDITRQTWGTFRSMEGFSDVTSRAEDIIYDQKFSGAAADLLNANIIARDLGLKEQSQVEDVTPDKGDRDKRRSRIKELFNRGTGRDS